METLCFDFAISPAERVLKNNHCPNFSRASFQHNCVGVGHPQVFQNVVMWTAAGL